MVAIASVILVLILFSLPAAFFGIKLLLEGICRGSQPSSMNGGLFSLSLFSAVTAVVIHCICLDRFLRFAMDQTWQQAALGAGHYPMLLMVAIALLGTLPGVAVLAAGGTYRVISGFCVKLPQPSA